MIVAPKEIAPSQDYLKPGTILYILKCFSDGDFDKLPPKPIVRRDEEGQLVAIDGHNLIAVIYCLDKEIDVHVANSAQDGIEVFSEADSRRNLELKEKFDKVLDDRKVAAARGSLTFADLIDKYSELFASYG